jgi:predicted flap endonuclease-1-like 5' DNA nuclease
MPPLEKVEGIGSKYAQKLRDAGIATTDDLLSKGAEPKGRQAIADESGISHKLILEWVNHVDPFRINGVGEEYADLLEEAGVDTVPELARRKAGNLYSKLTEINQQKNLVRQLPSESQVAHGIEQAGKLPRVISY